MEKFCVYHSLVGDYFNTINYFTINNYCKFYCKTVIIVTATMSDNSELVGYADFTRAILCHLANQNR